MTAPHDDRPGGGRSMWPAFLLGLLVVAPALVFLSTALGAAAGTFAVVVVVGAFVLLFTKDRNLRGIGAGVLAAVALGLIVLLGICFAYVNEMS